MIAFYEHREEQLFIGEMTHFPFPVHVHELAEILAVTSGTVRVGIDGTGYDLFPGDVAVVFPLTPHSYDRISGDASGLVAIFPTDIIPEYTGTFRSLEPEKPVLRAADAPADSIGIIRRLHALDMKDDLPLWAIGSCAIFQTIFPRISRLKAFPMRWASAPPICPISSQKSFASVSGGISIQTGLRKPVS